MWNVERLAENPIIHAGLDPSIGTNINGPSLIRTPDWLPKPFGRYYLYFADHGGQYIRLAFADDLRGPWAIYRPGTLRLDQTSGHGHVASPDVHVDEAARQIVMYFHTPVPGAQRTFRAASADGLHFVAETADLGPSYFRVFRHEDAFYALAMAGRPSGGILLRSSDGRTPFEPGPRFLPRQRHVAVQKLGDRLRIVFSRGEDCPEHLLVTDMDLSGPWHSWQPEEPRSLLLPETQYEGGRLPLEASRFGPAHGPVRQLRDPALFEEDGRTYLVYACAGESGLALACVR